MNFVPKLFLYSLIIVQIAIGCKEKINDKTASISIDFKDSPDSVCKIITFDPVNSEEHVLKEEKLDSSGSVTLTFDLENSVFSHLKIGKKLYGEILIEPGYNLKITLDPHDRGTTVYYSGKGAETNNYIKHIAKIRFEFYERNERYWNIEPDRYVKILDTVRNQMSSFHSRYKDSVNLSEKTLTLLKNKNELEVISLLLLYKHSNNQSLSTANEVPEIFRNITNYIPFDSSFLQLNMQTYAWILDIYLQSEIYPPLWNGKTLRAIEAEDYKYPMLTHDQISKDVRLISVKEFLLAKNITYWLNTNGHTPSVDTIYTLYKKEYPNSIYLSPLEKNYSEWLAIRAGQAAPEITGVTMDGTQLSLSDLKGKIVYIDVWATWCGPCREELPYYTKIFKRFEQNKQVEFLFVSVDSDKDKWLSHLKKPGQNKGIQIIEEKAGNQSSIFESYKIWGIPRFILVDKEGKISNPKAPRPSSGKVEEAIISLL